MRTRAWIPTLLLIIIFHDFSYGDAWFGVDKLRHLLASAIVTAAARHHLENTAGLSESSADRTAVSLTFTLATAKEVWDGISKKGDASFKDLAADGAGIGLGLILP